jgi:hypothetical protein
VTVVVSSTTSPTFGTLAILAFLIFPFAKGLFDAYCVMPADALLTPELPGIFLISENILLIIYLSA